MTRTVLIVEDNELNMKLFADLLEAEGYRVLRSGEGVAGFQIARQERPDLIVMDIQLPSISGLEVTRWLKEDPELALIPVVAVTAYAMKGDEARLRGLPGQADLGGDFPGNDPAADRPESLGYLILPSRNSTCLRTTGSYFFTTIFSVMVRAFFLVT